MYMVCSLHSTLIFFTSYSTWPLSSFVFVFFFCIVIIISLFFVVIALRETTSICSIYTDVTYKIRLMPEYLVSRNENRILYSNCRV